MNDSVIGIIGAGSIGTAIGRLAVAAGFEVLLSNSRGPDTLADKVAELGPLAQASTVEDAASGSDFAFVTIPFHQIGTLPADRLAGKIAVDVSNYAAIRDGHIAEIDDGVLTASAYLQKMLPEATVVKGFSNLNVPTFVLARPSGAADRTALPVAGDDAEAVAKFSSLMDQLGFDPVFAGSLAESWRFEPFMPAFVTPYLDNVQALLDFYNGKLEGADGPPADRGRRVTGDQLRNLLAQAKRGTTMEEALQHMADIARGQ